MEQHSIRQRHGLQDLVRIHTTTRLAAPVIGLLMVACQNSAPSSAAPPGPDVLVIVPALTALSVGATATLRAAVVSGGVPGQPVAASWSSDAPDVMPIQPDGRAYGARLGATTIRASYETLTASLPLRVVPDYAGNWSGWYRVTECTRLSGDGPSVCRFLEGGRFGIRVALTQNGVRLAGTLDLLNNFNDRIVETGPVDSDIDASNALVLSGMTRAIDPREPSQTTLSEWSSALTVDNAGMVGKFIQISTFRNAFGNQQMKYICQLEDVQRSKP